MRPWDTLKLFLSRYQCRSKSIPTNTWTHVGITYAGGANGAMVLYLNGAQVATTTYTATNHLTGVGLSFGNFGGCAGGQTQIDEVQVLSRVLNSSEVGTFGTLPPAPTGLMLTANFSAVQRLAWTAPAGITTKWRILRAEGAPASGNETFYTHAPNPPATFNADHLLPSTEYAWEVQAVQNGLVSPPSNELVATTLDPPAAPQNVTATALSSSRIQIAWSAVVGAKKYFLEQSPDGTTFSPAGSVLAPATTITKTNLPANTTFFYRVQAEDATLTRSAFSAVVSATTLP